MKPMTEDQASRYTRALHAVQAGVAVEMGQAATDHEFVPLEGPTSPKHLRVGVNSALINQAALVRVLIEKGILTDDEYYESLITEAELEVERYEQRISERTGAKVTLV